MCCDDGTSLGVLLWHRTSATLRKSFNNMSMNLDQLHLQAKKTTLAVINQKFFLKQIQTLFGLQNAQPAKIVFDFLRGVDGMRLLWTDLLGLTYSPEPLIQTAEVSCPLMGK